MFEAVEPFLTSRGIRFKAPASLADLVELNAGLRYGYNQVGKFITVYPDSAEVAVEIAGKLDALTRRFIPLTVPFDNQYREASNVFYRYGRFVELETRIGAPAIKNASGEFVYDDNRNAVPEWVTNPFPEYEYKTTTEEPQSPFATTYLVLEAITQRGKGGTYRAIDIKASSPRLCVVKQGRRHGDMDWSGQDGYALVKNECENMVKLRAVYNDVPAVLDSFECGGDFYFVMEYVDGTSLHELMMVRRRRFAISQIIDYAIEAAKTIENINRAGWVWNDCKPSNLIVTETGELRPIDFENAHPVAESPRFKWSSRGYSRDSVTGDGYGLGAMIYFLLTGRFYDPEATVPIGKLRRGVPKRLTPVVDELLQRQDVRIGSVRKKLESIARQMEFERYPA